MHEEIKKVKYSPDGTHEEETITRRPSGSGFGELLGAITAITLGVIAVTLIAHQPEQHAEQTQGISQVVEVHHGEY